LNLPGSTFSTVKKSSRKVVGQKAEVIEQKQCSSCGSMVHGSLNVCDHCGYFLTRPVLPQSLAQKRGLAPLPIYEKDLSTEEWNSLETKLDSRGDAFCPIW
jgi:hypothetical protein